MLWRVVVLGCGLRRQGDGGAARVGGGRQRRAQTPLDSPRGVCVCVSVCVRVIDRESVCLCLCVRDRDWKRVYVVV